MEGGVLPLAQLLPVVAAVLMSAGDHLEASGVWRPKVGSRLTLGLPDKGGAAVEVAAVDDAAADGGAADDDDAASRGE